MSTEVASGSGSATPLLPELLRGTIYKRNQGKLVRQITCLAIWVIVALGCYSLYGSLIGTFDGQRAMEVGIPVALLALGMWVGFRAVNWPPFGDFLIAVEAEMNKVSWPSRDELIRASIVVIVTIFILAVSLFLFDIIWAWAFQKLGISP